MGKMMNGLAVGMVMGAAVGMLVVPQLDRRTQRNIRRTTKRLTGMAEDAYDNMMCMCNMK